MATISKSVDDRPGAEPDPRPMVSKMRVQNFRSILDAEVEPGRLTVIIGANGSGKSNLLEAVAMGGAAAAGMLGHEFLASRGIRPTVPELLAPRFEGSRTAATRVAFAADGRELVTTISFADDGELTADHTVVDPGFDELVRRLGEAGVARLVDDFDGFDEVVRELLGDEPRPLARRLVDIAATRFPRVRRFLLYAPDYAALRTFSDEGQIRPLGVRGEGLFQHLVHLSRRSPEVLDAISERLRVIDWFDGFVIPNDLGPGEKRLAIRDRYLAADVLLDQRAANEGFLFLLFVHLVIVSPNTPPFFAIDNADTSLNPKLCARMVADIAELAREHDKQVILTTHNPAMLDGLDLADDDQRLLVCERNLDGFTTFRRISARKGPGPSLSEAFLRGYLGGLPGSF